MTSPALPRVFDLGSMSAPVTVVGDVHLSEHDPALTTRFEAFLARVPDGTTLVLLGDLFNWWVGGAQARLPFERHILDLLRVLPARDIRLAFLGGNRDYLFNGAAGLEIDLWPDVVRARWGERTVVLSHGDLLCTSDVPYQRARRFFRSPFGLRLFHALPFAVTGRIARRARKISTAEFKRKSPVEVGLDYGEARRWLEGYEADALVLGHVHTGVHHRFPGEPSRDVYVLKDWGGAGNAVTFDGGAIRLDVVKID